MNKRTINLFHIESVDITEPRKSFDTIESLYDYFVCQDGGSSYQTLSDLDIKNIGFEHRELRIGEKRTNLFFGLYRKQKVIYYQKGYYIIGTNMKLSECLVDYINSEKLSDDDFLRYNYFSESDGLFYQKPYVTITMISGKTLFVYFDNVEQAKTYSNHIKSKMVHNMIDIPMEITSDDELLSALQPNI